MKGRAGKASCCVRAPRPTECLAFGSENPVDVRSNPPVILMATEWAAGQHRSQGSARGLEVQRGCDVCLRLHPGGALPPAACAAGQHGPELLFVCAQRPKLASQANDSLDYRSALNPFAAVPINPFLGQIRLLSCCHACITAQNSRKLIGCLHCSTSLQTIRYFFLMDNLS